MTNRRDFIRQTAGAGAAFAAGGIAGLPTSPANASRAEAPDKRYPLPVVDTHQHLWDLSRFRLPWVDSVPELRRSFVTKDYLEATHGLNVVQAVYMEVDVAPDQQVAEAEHVIEICKRPDAPTSAAVISGRPGSDPFKEYITRFKNNRYIKGVRQVLHGPATPRGFCLGKTFVRDVRLLGELGMSFDLCMRPAELADGARLVDQCPDTRFIVDHCGNADPKAFEPLGRRETDGVEPPGHDRETWRRDMSRLAERKNVVCKISGIVARARKGSWKPEDLAPIIDHCLDAFGPDRVLFGGDWPVCTLVATYRQWLDGLLAVIRNRSRDDQRKLLHDNAIRFYGLT